MRASHASETVGLGIGQAPEPWREPGRKLQAPVKPLPRAGENCEALGNVSGVLHNGSIFIFSFWFSEAMTKSPLCPEEGFRPS